MERKSSDGRQDGAPACTVGVRHKSAARLIPSGTGSGSSAR